MNLSTANLATADWRLPNAASIERHVFLLWLAVVVSIAAALRLVFIPGPSGSDDVIYSLRGVELARGIWHQSTLLVDLRYGINLPISLFARAFPGSELALAGWSLLCSLLEIALVFVFATYAWGLRAGICAALLLAFMPMHITHAGRALGDAPLAALYSATMVAFYFAESRRNALLYVIAGAAAGFSWWVKPVALPPFALALLLYVLVARTWRKEWLLSIAACLAVMLAEWLMFWIQLGDPFISIKSNFSGISRDYIQAANPWGAHSPWFYFRHLWLEIRDMWILPHLAVVGLALLYFHKWKRSTWDNGSRFAAYWFVALLFSFSFFVYSINPLKIIPKQTNYALIFSAPVAVLGGYVLALMSSRIRLVTLMVVLLGGIFLAAVEQQKIRAKSSKIIQMLELARAHKDVMMFVPLQTIKMAELKSALSGEHGSFDNLVSVRELATRQTAEPAKRLMVLDPTLPELRDRRIARRMSDMIEACGRPIGTLPARPTGAGRIFVEILAHVRGVIPHAIDRHLSFANEAITPPHAVIYSVSESCS